MRIRMVESRRESEDGFEVKQYVKDNVFDMRDSLARRLIALGWAVKADENESNAA